MYPDYTFLTPLLLNWSLIQRLVLTDYQAESVTKGGLCPGQAVVWQVDILRCPIDVAPTNPSS